MDCTGERCIKTQKEATKLFGTPTFGGRRGGLVVGVLTVRFEDLEEVNGALEHRLDCCTCT